MYATEKYLKMEVKELLSQIQAVANDLGGDINYLNNQHQDLVERMSLLEKAIQSIKEEVERMNNV